MENGGEEKLRDKSTCPGFDVADDGATSKTRRRIRVWEGWGAQNMLRSNVQGYGSERNFG